MKKVIAIYPGRFQPFGPHHAKTFQWLCSKFGKENCYIATTDKTGDSSPFNFSEKKEIISKYGFSNNVVQVKNPYTPTEILSKYPENTIAVFLVGEKDQSTDPRFTIGFKKSGEPTYFQEWSESASVGWKKHGYLIKAPHQKIAIGNTEMSGTALRKFLQTATASEFTKVFGWFDAKTFNMMKKKTELNENIFTVEWWKKVIEESLLKEGGAAGHMDHVFNIDWVDNGNDLILAFQKTIDYLKEHPASVKIDGLNVSVKLITVNGKKQFAIDRGSMKELDVKGVTINDLESRFGVGHGLVTAGKIVLGILNSSITSISSELRAIGMWNDESILLNMEYVSGQTNVIGYNENMIVLHGCLRIDNNSTGRRKTSELPVDQKIIDALAFKIDKVAETRKFKVITNVPTKFDAEPNLGIVLSQRYPIKVNGKVKSKTLKEWLSSCIIPDKKIELTTGKKVEALSKEILIQLKNEIDVADLVVNESDFESAINGYITYLACMVLGDEILENLSSDLGPVKNQEGIVIKSESISHRPFKITGSFILGSLASSFKK